MDCWRQQRPSLGRDEDRNTAVGCDMIAPHWCSVPPSGGTRIATSPTSSLARRRCWAASLPREGRGSQPAHQPTTAPHPSQAASLPREGRGSQRRSLGAPSSRRAQRPSLGRDEDRNVLDLGRKPHDRQQRPSLGRDEDRNSNAGDASSIVLRAASLPREGRGSQQFNRRVVPGHHRAASLPREGRGSQLRERVR